MISEFTDGFEKKNRSEDGPGGERRRASSVTHSVLAQQASFAKVCKFCQDVPLAHCIPTNLKRYVYVPGVDLLISHTKCSQGSSFWQKTLENSSAHCLKLSSCPARLIMLRFAKSARISVSKTLNHKMLGRNSKLSPLPPGWTQKLSEIQS